jgi:bacteriocin biosynthesis cyclodehydratase domain-containing protein
MLAPTGRFITVPSTEILLITDVDEVRLSGELFCDLSVYLDGSLTVGEITEAMVAANLATREEVPAAIGILHDAGYVVDARDAARPDQVYRLWWGAQGPSRVHVLGLGATPKAIVEQALTEHGIAISDSDAADAWVVLVDDYLHPELAAVTADAPVPVLVAMPSGARTMVGPWLGAPGPCATCLASRQRFNRQVELFAIREGDRMGPVSRGWTTATAWHTAAEIAMAIDRRAAGARGVHDHADPAIEHLLVIDHLTGERTAHQVVRRPQCAQCGSPLAIDDERTKITLSSVALDAKDDGSYRRLTPRQTIDTFGHHVSPRTGVVEHLTSAYPADSVLHVVESGVNLATVRKGGSPAGFRHSAGGKGTTSDQATAGALAEAIERYSTAYSEEGPTIVASAEDLGDDAIDPRTMTLFSAAQHAGREQWNAANPPFLAVPAEFDPALAMEWSPGWSLSRGRRVWLPTPYAYYLYRGSHPTNGCRSDSNGNAAGTSIEDAILQGFFELVERDAVAMWWYNRAARPGVDIDAYRRTYDDPYFDRLREHYADSLDRDVWALDLTNDLGIPAFVAVSTSRSGRPRTLLGFGAHPDPRGALLRALTEMNQMLAMIPSIEAGMDSIGEPASGPVRPEVAWWQRESLDQDPHLSATGTRTTPDDHRNDWTLDGKANVERTVGLVEARGMEMHVVNLTQPDIGMPVVKVCVPGMRHFWPRYAPGRLYDVPVDLGWVDAALTEPELNPTPIFW